MNAGGQPPSRSGDPSEPEAEKFLAWLRISNSPGSVAEMDYCLPAQGPDSRLRSVASRDPGGQRDSVAGERGAQGAEGRGIDQAPPPPGPGARMNVQTYSAEFRETTNRSP